MKKILILGGDHFTIPVVEAAKRQGYYTITCDYLPDNVAHRISDKYINYSTIDKEGILEAARNLQIDGIVTFTDSGVVTCAFVAQHLGLPMTGPLESVEILQNKARFRQFLAENGFNVPKARGYKKAEEALDDNGYFNLPVIVKPVDAAGSKGVTKVDSWENIGTAIEWAIEHSFSGDFIIEEWIEKKGNSSDSDCFSYKGKLEVATFSSQWFDVNAANPYAPAAFTWPSSFTAGQEQYLRSELQRLISLLGMKSSVYNVETRIGQDDKPYIMEVSPRGGGNRLSEMIHFSLGVDLITNAVRVAVGDEPIDYQQKALNGHWGEIILHSAKTGEFVSLEIADDFKTYVVEVDIWIKKGDHVNEFQAARDAIGTLVIRSNNAEELRKIIENQSSWLRVNVK